MNLVWSSTLEGPSKRFALLALADRASDQGEITALGVPNLCRKTGIKRSTMFRLLKELETEDSLIQRVEQRRENNSRKASRFWINLPLLLAMQHQGDDDREQDDSINPFTVSAAQPPIPDRDGPPSQIGTGPVPDMDGLGVPNWDGARPGSGPLSPSPPETSDPDPDARARDGRTDESSTEQNQKLAEQAEVIVKRLDLRKVEAQPKQQRQVQQRIARLLGEGFAFDVVARHAERKLAEAKTCTYFLRGLAAEHISTDTHTGPRRIPEWCGQCDRPDYRFREDAEGRPIKCHQCHPAASEAA